MTFSDIIKQSALNQFLNSDLSSTSIIITLALSYLIAMYIYFVYRMVTKNSFYVKNFGVSMCIISVITAGIVLAMQSSLVISLGMVGALSIVRFRTAIKDPMDLLFLFWSIGTGIICGAGLFEVAFFTAIITTVGMIILEIIPANRAPYVLVINGTSELDETQMYAVIKAAVKHYRVKSKNLSQAGTDYIMEISLKADEKGFTRQLMELAGVRAVSLLDN